MQLQNKNAADYRLEYPAACAYLEINLLLIGIQ